MSDQFGRYFVALPSSPGTSGSPVLDLHGNLVGIVVAGVVNRAAEAGWITDIVPGGLVFDLVRYAIDHIESPSSPSASPPPQPSLPPCDGTSSTREPSWRGLTCQ
jgi:S1-C subfamily serine protease